MIFRSRLLSALSLLVLAGACAAEPPPPPQLPPVAPRPAPPPPPDVTAVPTPSNLVLYARLSNTSASLKVATDWARLPSIEPSTLLEGFLEGVMSSKEYGAFATIVDASQPVDFAASFEVKLPPKGYGALSAAVKDIDAAKSLLGRSFDLTPGTNGVIALTLRSDQGTEKSEKADDDDKGACEIAPAAGAAPFRLVCASSRDALAALGPYLTRTTPRVSIPSDMHLELHAGPVGGLASLGRLQAASLLTSLMGLNAATEPATAEIVSAGIGDTFDYLADLDTQTMDVTLDPAHGGLTYRTTFKSQTSLIARLSTAHPEKVDVAPDAFWQLPADVDLASFGAGIDEADLKHPRDLLVAAVDEQLKKKKLGDGDRQALTGVLAHTMRASRAVVAHGMVDNASYWVWEQDAPPATTEKNARELVATWNRRRREVAAIGRRIWLAAAHREARRAHCWAAGRRASRHRVGSRRRVEQARSVCKERTGGKAGREAASSPRGCDQSRVEGDRSEGAAGPRPMCSTSSSCRTAPGAGRWSRRAKAP